MDKQTTTQLVDELKEKVRNAGNDKKQLLSLYKTLVRWETVLVFHESEDLRKDGYRIQSLMIEVEELILK